jgi:hypothetical protein
MVKVTQTDERLTIVDGNAKAGFIGTIVAATVIGSGVISCSLHTDFLTNEAMNEWHYNATILAAIFLLVFGVPLIGLASHHNEIVLDKTRGTLRHAVVLPFGRSIRREVPLWSIRGARVVGSRGAFWQFEFDCESGQPLAPSSMRTDAYVPDDLQKIADQVNQFLGRSGRGPASSPQSA